MRALVLAAGLGTRLRPLTHHLPKPLLPVPRRGGVGTVAGATLEALAPYCDAVALNLHHLGEKIESHLGKEQNGLPLLYSPEPELLGTLGPLHELSPFLGGRGDDFLLVNGDSLCDWPLEDLIRRHRRTGAEATLLVLPTPPDEKLGGGLGLDENGDVVQLRQMPPRAEVQKRRDFAGCHLISASLLREIPQGPGDILEGLYQKLLERGAKIATVELEAQRPWHDLGTPERYLAAITKTAFSPLAEIGIGFEITNSVIDRDARVGAGAHLENCVLCAGAIVGEGARLKRVIVGPGAQVPARAKMVGSMVMP